MNRYSRLLVVIDPDKPVDRVLHFACAVLVLKLAPIMAHANEAPTVIPARVAQVPS